MMKSVLSIITLVVFSLPGFSQYTKDIKAAFQDGEYFLAYQAYEDALIGYQKVYKVDPDNANVNYRIGQCYLNIPGEQSNAIPYLEKAITNITENYKEGDIKEREAPADALFFLGNAYQLQYELDKAKTYFEKYLQLLDTTNRENFLFVEQQIASIDYARKLMQHPVYFKLESVGNLINTSSADFDPVVSGDQKSMVYITSLKFYDAIFFVKKGMNNWGRPVNITPEVQSDGDLYPTALSPDGKTLLMSKSDIFNSDIWVSYYDGNEWSKAEKLGKQINTKYWESSASFSPDGKTLYFTSDRKESLGGLDIFASQWDDVQSSWGPPVNLGPDINTPLNEETPYMCKDGKTLYFSSQGFNSMGGFDIFHTTLQNDGSWSTPVNLGYPLNTTDNDLGFDAVTEGISGYYSMYEPTLSKGDKDIFLVEIYSDKNPRPVLISGNVDLQDRTATYTGTPEVALTDKATGKMIASAKAPSGKYQFTISTTGTYDLQFSSKDYTTETKGINIPPDYSVGSLEENATLEKAVVPTVWLPSVFFGYNQSVIRKDETPTIEALASILKTYPGLTIKLSGYTDAKGSQSYNKRLALQRANAVKKALSNAGVDVSRIQVVGLGEKDFVAINQWPNGKDCPDGRTFNRRVSVAVVSAPVNFIKPKPIEVPDQLSIK